MLSLKGQLMKTSGCVHALYFPNGICLCILCRRGLQTFFDASCTARDLRIKARKHLTDSLDENQVGLDMLSLPASQYPNIIALSQTNIKALFEQLKRAYDKRAALWTELDVSLNQCGKPTSTLI